MRRAVAFLTNLGGAAAPSSASVSWFPVVGALLGAAVGGVWWGADRLWHPALAAAIAVLADLAVTGFLHADGLVDSADGLLPPMERARRLEVMADPAAGAFGVVTAIVVILVRWAAFATRRPSVLLVAGLWCASRTVMAVALRHLPYARRGGLAESFRPGPDPAGGAGASLGVGVGGIGLAGALAAWGAGVPGLLSLAAAVLGAGLVLALAQRRLGGYTGDVLGACGLVGETAGLVVAAARW